MSRVAAGVSTGAVTIASRDVETNGVAVHKGAWLGLADGSPIAGGETFDEVARRVVERLLAEPREILTLLTGEEPQPLDRLLAELAERFPSSSSRCTTAASRTIALLLSAE